MVERKRSRKWEIKRLIRLASCRAMQIFCFSSKASLPRRRLSLNMWVSCVHRLLSHT